MVSDQVRHKPSCATPEDSYRPGFSYLLIRWVILSNHIYVALTKAQLSCAEIAKLICVFVFIYSNSRLFRDGAVSSEGHFAKGHSFGEFVKIRLVCILDISDQR